MIYIISELCRIRYLSVWLLLNLGGKSHDISWELGMHNRTLYRSSADLGHGKLGWGYSFNSGSLSEIVWETFLRLKFFCEYEKFVKHSKTVLFVNILWHCKILIKDDAKWHKSKKKRCTNTHTKKSDKYQKLSCCINSHQVYQWCNTTLSIQYWLS